MRKSTMLTTCLLRCQELEVGNVTSERISHVQLPEGMRCDRGIVPIWRVESC